MTVYSKHDLDQEARNEARSWRKTTGQSVKIVKWEILLNQQHHSLAVTLLVDHGELLTRYVAI